MVTVNAMGDKCPVPVIKTKKALDALTAPTPMRGTSPSPSLFGL